MNPEFRPNLNRQTICGIIILLLVSIRIGIDIRYQFIRNEPARNFERYANTEAILRSAAPQEGVFILFKGYTADDASVSRICNDALYTLYPKPVLVGDPAHLAGAPDEILPGNVEPDDAWLRAHHIGSVLTLINHGDHPPRSSVRWVQPPPSETIPDVPQTKNRFTAALYLICCFTMGYAIVSWLINERFSANAIGLSAVLGPGIMGLCLMLFSMLGVRPGRVEILLITLPFAVFGIVSIFRKPNSAPVTRASGPCWFRAMSKGSVLRAPPAWAGGPCHERAICGILAICAIGYATLTIAISTLLYPTVEWDAFSIWQYKAKLLTLFPLSPQPSYFTTICLSQTHLRYPILPSMISAGVNAMAGGFDQFARAPSPLLFAGLIVAIFAAIDRASGRLPALVTIALMTNLGVMYQWAGSGTAEMSLTAFYGCSILCLLRWKQDQRLGDLLLTALFSACMAQSKNEGLALAAVNLIVLVPRDMIAGWSLQRPPVAAEAATPVYWCALSVRRLLNLVKPAVIYALLIALLLAPWQCYIRNLPRTDEDYAGRLNLHNLIANTGRLPSIFRGFGDEMFNWAHWDIFWIMLWIAAAAAIFLKRGSRATTTLWALLALHLLAYVPPLMVTNWKMSDLLTATGDRLLMHAIPAAALLIGMTFGTDQSRAVSARSDRGSDLAPAQKRAQNRGGTHRL